MENIILIAKEEKDLGVVIEDNLSPEKHINIIFGDTHDAKEYTNGFTFPR